MMKIQDSSDDPLQPLFRRPFADFTLFDLVCAALMMHLTDMEIFGNEEVVNGEESEDDLDTLFDEPENKRRRLLFVLAYQRIRQRKKKHLQQQPRKQKRRPPEELIANAIREGIFKREYRMSLKHSRTPSKLRKTRNCLQSPTNHDALPTGEKTHKVSPN